MQELIHCRIRQTALGLMAMATTSKGICSVEFGDDQATLRNRLKAEFPDASVQFPDAEDGSRSGAWIDALATHLDSGAALPDLPLDIRGTDFEVMVWNALREIPRGQVLGYGEFAKKIGRPGSVRAVASACGRNRIGVLIPCHRVLRGDGQLGGYRWGLSRKKALIEAGL